MTKRFGVSLPDELLQKLDKLAKKKGYDNRSEAIRDLIRDKFVEEEWSQDSAEVVGTVTLVYNHHSHDLSDKLADLQHSHFKNIISTTHIHLDQHNCLEVLVVRGKSSKVKEISDQLIATKGVKHGKLVMTSTGKKLV
ncbi:nickel-responsive regulator [candidate division WOR-1 bacterium RIFOXYB2_FULL_42_35]|uniref:Putative nickel-responsive regulator n=1 Tax=candidate division WOR-1 bacterium RIFOXYC2_FULL_41_25 TaxID=1802586 RepID=A0A1F4TM65_UNCSA|nr:MAG: nickel-responsive regulator [candidate division WOR-1 bacterium RIFOXYB2_FULL_42_35]OGC23088.1 MAG: nickel-responsive regulator [candidate division WOR-1 bacterium RIFOXYA2_FULL_41_14]OGC33659.1 MAG: nickel-responsive regulator [candidate division WOR-1 bacterium RIFOXYC2_FULL_41_25]OGC42300.1 MAG: nickel-responsive regulator [candidate division WOR-1 bacterium RIFOXYD2_FULL_41_8]